MRCPQTIPPRSIRSFQIASLALILASTSAAAESRRSPHRFIPAKGLVAYIEYEGLDAHAAAWNASAAHGILVENHAGAMMSELSRQVLDRLMKEAPDCKLTGADFTAVLDHLVHRGLVIAYHEEAGNALTTTYVLNGIGEKGIRERLDRVIATALGLKKGEELPAPVRIRGRDVFSVQPEQNDLAARSPEPPASWWFEGNDLVVMLSASLKVESAPDPQRKKPAPVFASLRTRVFDTFDGKEPDVTKNPAYASAIAEGRDIKGFEANGLLLVDPIMAEFLISATGSLPGQIAAPNLPEAKFISPSDAPPQLMLPHADSVNPADLPDDVFGPPVDSALILAGNVPPARKDKEESDPLKALGLDGIKRIVVRWGFQDKALLTILRIEAPAPRSGLLACLDQPAFRKNGLPPIPRGTASFIVGSFDSAGSYAKYLGLLNALVSRARWRNSPARECDPGRNRSEPPERSPASGAELVCLAAPFAGLETQPHR